MARVEKFEDLIVWQKSRDFVKEVYSITKGKSFSNDYYLVDQLKRAVISINLNIVEGFERNGDKEFHQFLSISKASCSEVKAILILSLDLGYIDNETYKRLRISADEISRTLHGLMSYLKGSELKGAKFK
jgi:four helix bundle protein